jgi:hypothetical protein
VARDPGGPLAMLSILLVAVAALSGCAEEAAPPAGQLDLSGLEVATSSTTGAIKGVVVDEAIRPIAGANVTVLPGELHAVSDEAGLFAFEGLLPGVYFVRADAFAHAGTQASVDVKADSAATVRILLTSVYVPMPYHDLYHYEGFMQAYASFASFAAEVVAPGVLPCTCTWSLTPPLPGLTTFVYEADGEVAMENPAPVYGTVYWEFIGETDHAIHSSHDTFPVYQVFEIGDFADDTWNWTVRLTGSQWVHVNTSFDVYVTAWYNSAPPEGWSFVQGDT